MSANLMNQKVTKVTRRTHKKSKLGCPQCRKRKVKCDERLSSCVNCEIRKIRCGYLDFTSRQIDEIRIKHWENEGSDPSKNPIPSQKIIPWAQPEVIHINIQQSASRIKQKQEIKPQNDITGNLFQYKVDLDDCEGEGEIQYHHEEDERELSKQQIPSKDLEVNITELMSICSFKNCFIWPNYDHIASTEYNDRETFNESPHPIEYWTPIFTSQASTNHAVYGHSPTTANNTTIIVNSHINPWPIALIDQAHTTIY